MLLVMDDVWANADDIEHHGPLAVRKYTFVCWDFFEH